MGLGWRALVGLAALVAAEAFTVAPHGYSRSTGTSPRFVLASAVTDEVQEVLRLGIKAVAVGVKGSRPIPDELVPELIAATESLHASRADSSLTPARERMASFLGTLFVKHDIVGSDEEMLEAVARLQPGLSGQGRVRGCCSRAQLLAVAAPGGSNQLQELAAKILDGENLGREEAKLLGSRLLAEDEDSELKTLCAHVLRVRYETPEEWSGLLDAQAETIDTRPIDEATRQQLGVTNVIQIAEPYDGVNRSNMFTPITAWHLQQQHGLLSISQVGETSGPKYGPNLRDLARSIGADDGAAFATSSQDIAVAKEVPKFGWFMDQAALSPPLASWVNLRRNIIKRPFLATAEKFVDPCAADVVLASAFHPSFTAKMMTMAEQATDFRACIVTRRGMEGTLCFGLGKPVTLSCGVRGSDGLFERHEFSFGPEDLGLEIQMDTPLESVSADDLAAKCVRYTIDGTTGDPTLDKQVAVTLAGIDKALDWVLPRLSC
ncbi:unnamed protein product [Chrysoparadoxa australica]